MVSDRCLSARLAVGASVMGQRSHTLLGAVATLAQATFGARAYDR